MKTSNWEEKCLKNIVQNMWRELAIMSRHPSSFSMNFKSRLLKQSMKSNAINKFISPLMTGLPFTGFDYKFPKKFMLLHYQALQNVLSWDVSEFWFNGCKVTAHSSLRFVWEIIT